MSGDNKRNRQSKVESDDRAVVIYHVVYSHEGFEESAQILFKLVQRAQRVMPGKPRKLFLDIEGHRNSEGDFDADMFELLTVFIPDFLARFLSEIYCPLFKVTDRTTQQENEVPLELVIK
jgi:hypothetical protein